MLFGACRGSLHGGCPEQISLKPAGTERRNGVDACFHQPCFPLGSLNSLVDLYVR